MKKHSAGALIFTVYDNEIFIVLGMEKNEWFPFKGTKNNNESLKSTAIREIFEETCGLVVLNDIHLDCKYSTKRKYYHIGLAFVNINIIKKFHKNRKFYEETDINDENYKYLEKTDIKLFNINKLSLYQFHNITDIPIQFYKKFLNDLQQKFYDNIDIKKKGVKKNINKIIYNYSNNNINNNIKNNIKNNINRINLEKFNFIS